jgi:hypothetical protein
MKQKHRKAIIRKMNQIEHRLGAMYISNGHRGAKPSCKAENLRRACFELGKLRDAQAR